MVHTWNVHVLSNTCSVFVVNVYCVSQAYICVSVGIGVYMLHMMTGVFVVCSWCMCDVYGLYEVV